MAVLDSRLTLCQAAQSQTTLEQAGPVQEYLPQKSCAPTSMTNPHLLGSSHTTWIPESGSSKAVKASLKRKVGGPDLAQPCLSQSSLQEPPTAENSSVCDYMNLRVKFLTVL